MAAILKRRQLYIVLSLVLIGFLFSRQTYSQARSETGKKGLNVIVLFSDDQGTLDLNCYGSKDLDTPNLDKLAQEGVRFSNFYAGSSVCSPSRATLLTGRYPHRAGVPGNAESRPELFGTGEGLSSDQFTLAELLKENGYRTGHFGKWHLGTSPGPNGSGFDESFGFLGGCIDKWSHFNYGGVSWGAAPRRHDWFHNGEEEWHSGIHSGDLIVREAVRFMETPSEKPFFLYVAFGSPHYPMQPYDKYRLKYANLAEPRRSYAALVSTLDEQIGRLIDKVDELRLRDNTLIIFQADQGHSTEARANYGGGNAGSYRGAKGSLFEGGILIPAIVSLPHRLPKGEVRDQFCTGADWFPTIAELCEIGLPDWKIDGISLAETLRSDKSPGPHTSWHWQLGNQWAVRKGDWKLIVNAKDTSDGRNIQTLEKPFLANLSKDPTEKTDFAEENAAVVDELTRMHDAWLSDVGY